MDEEKLIEKNKPEELILAEQLIDEGKYDAALQLMINFEETGELPLYEIVSCNLLKSSILHYQCLYENSLKLAEETYDMSLGLGKSLLSVDALMWMANALIILFRLDKVKDIIKQGEELLKTLPQELTKAYKQREAFIAFVKGRFYYRIGDADRALKHLEHSLAKREELGIKHEIAQSLSEMAITLCLHKGEADRALKYAERSLALAKESSKKYYIANSLHILAMIYSLQGELDRSIRLYEQSLAIFKKLNNRDGMAWDLNNVANCYRMKGELDRALECIEQAIALNRELGKLHELTNNHDFLIRILIDKGDIERAQISLHDMERLNSQLNDKEINFVYLFDKALVLKTSPRAIKRGKAEDILKQLLEEEDLFYEYRLKALYNLCELLLTELRITNEQEVLDELTEFIGQLLEFAEKTHSYWIMGETYLLQAKLALLSLDLKETRRLLTQGQQVAEKYGLKMLARKISNEHDELLKQMTIWENLKKSEATLNERLKLARLNEQMDNMLRKHVVEPDEIQEEESVVILIISKGGNPIFSQSFEEGWSFQDHLFGGFLSAVNSFSDEMFSQGLDRAIFGEYTIIMNAVSPFIICYLFKGQSFLAQQRMKHFIDTIQNDKKIWEPIKKYYQANRLVQEKDIPSLDLLVNEIFIERAILL